MILLLSKVKLFNKIYSITYHNKLINNHNNSGIYFTYNKIYSQNQQNLIINLLSLQINSAIIKYTPLINKQILPLIH